MSLGVSLKNFKFILTNTAFNLVSKRQFQTAATCFDLSVRCVIIYVNLAKEFVIETAVYLFMVTQKLLTRQWDDDDTGPIWFIFIYLFSFLFPKTRYMCCDCGRALSRNLICA